MRLEQSLCERAEDKSLKRTVEAWAADRLSPTVGFKLCSKMITAITVDRPLQLLRLFINIIPFPHHKYLMKSAGHRYNHSINVQIEVERV